MRETAATGATVQRAADERREQGTWETAATGVTSRVQPMSVESREL